MNQSQKYIQSVSSSLPRVAAVQNNAPAQYADRRYQYLSDRRTLFDEARDYLATDFVRARVQGLNPNDFYAWTETEIRLSDVSTQSVTAFDSKQYDDFKEILFRSRAIDYIPVGAYIETMGSYWMVVNPGNMSSPTTNAVIARCRAHWSFYDAYGNVRWEPLVIDRRTMLSNRNESPENLVLMEGYFNIKCQKNANTVKLRDNQRIILGSYAYYITGYTDFFEEFTGDDESAHVINITARREEPEEHDDLERHIADGLLYTWSADISGQTGVPVGGTGGARAHMLKNGEVVTPGWDTPQTWVFTSSDEEVLAVEDDGNFTGVSDGAAVITATLTENPSLTASMTVTVGETFESVRFIGTVPAFIPQYSTVWISAAHEVNGENTNDALTWSFSGAASEDYTAEVDESGTHCRVTCDSPSAEPLIITAAYGNESAAVSIKLLGY